MHNIYAPFIITSVRVIHSVATPNPTLAVWRLPGPAPASCCPPALLLWRQAAWKQGDMDTWRPPMPVSTSTMPGCWAGLAWYRGCTAVDPRPGPAAGGGGHKSEALHWPVLAWPGPRHTPPHSDLSKHCVLHPASTLYCHNLTSAHQAAELIVLSHCTHPCLNLVCESNLSTWI